MKLYTPLGHPRGNKILTLARYLKLELETPSFNIGQAKNKEFAAKSPLKKFPLLETSEGCLYESNAIIRHLVRVSGRQDLYGKDNYEMSQVDSWLETISSDLELAVCQWIYPIFGYTEYNEAVFKKAQQDVKDLMKHLDTVLQKQPFLVGQVMTLADIAAASVLVYPFRMVFDKSFRNNYKNVQKWFEGLANQEEFKYVWGRIFFANEAQSPVVPQKKVGKNQGEEKKEEGKKPEQKQHKEAKGKEQKKEEPKKQEPKKKQKEEEEEEFKEEKPKEPEYPQTTFILDEWKKLYANTKDRASTLPYFFEKYDPNGWSIWYLNYEKAEGEGQVLYMTNNLVKGFLQRMENMRKISFGVMGIYGQEPSLEVRAVFMWRGVDTHPWMKDHPSFEYYHSRKLDLTQEADKQLLTQYWTQLDENQKVEGLEVKETKIWK